jgi:CubicO group peptidase (beta-lactamase class C family)
MRRRYRVAVAVAAVLPVVGVLLWPSLGLAEEGRGAVFPRASWDARAPADTGLDSARLDAFRDYVGGRGCVVRHGYMVYTWGDQALRHDVASAVKPVISHFLFTAIEEGRLSSLDEPVVKWESCLRELNPELGFKDRRITFRHMATQTSCYGVSEKPGTAFDYNDWQMALLWDTLFLRVYRVPCADVDERVLRPLLMKPLGCEDNPTFTAPGKGKRAGRLEISVRDFARFGLLYLHRGDWRGKRLISEAHAVAAVTSPLPNSIPRTSAHSAAMCPGQRSLGSMRIPDDQADHEGSYSYLWWINGVGRDGRRHWPSAPVDAYGAFGHDNGQRAVVVIPSLDMVVSWNDTTLGEKQGNPCNEALGLLVKAVDAGRPARR